MITRRSGKPAKQPALDSHDHGEGHFDLTVLSVARATLDTITKHRLTVTPAAGGWATWVEVEGREGRGLFVRAWAPHLPIAVERIRKQLEKED